jgi:hypothetical protein
MTNAEHQARYRAKHGRGADPGNAARQQRWRDRQKAKQGAREAAEAAARPPDPLFIEAAAHLESEPDLLRRLHAYWPLLAPPVRRQMAAGKGFRFWLRED